MIVVRLISGLGNQLFQYAVGRQVSLTRGVPLKLDTSFFEGQSLRSYKLDHYQITASLATSEEVASYKRLYTDPGLYGKIFRKVEGLLPKRRKRWFTEAEWWGYEPDLLKASGHVYLDGYWQHYRYFEHLHPRIFQELTVKDQAPPEYRQHLEAITANGPSVSVHIRRGDYITDPNANQLMGVLHMSYYEKAAALVREKIKDPSFYVFSDDLGWARDHLKIDGPVHYVQVPGPAGDCFELELMSKCQHQVIANSTYSWWGAFLNRNPGKVVVAPAEWVKDQNINQRIHLQFPGWIKI